MYNELEVEKTSNILNKKNGGDSMNKESKMLVETMLDEIKHFIKEKRRDIDIHCFSNYKLSTEAQSNLSCEMDEMFEEGIKKLHSNIFYWEDRKSVV